MRLLPRIETPIEAGLETIYGYRVLDYKLAASFTEVEGWRAPDYSIKTNWGNVGKCFADAN